MKIANFYNIVTDWLSPVSGDKRDSSLVWFLELMIIAFEPITSEFWSSFLDKCSTTAAPKQSPQTFTVVLKRSLEEKVHSLLLNTTHNVQRTGFFNLTNILLYQKKECTLKNLLLDGPLYIRFAEQATVLKINDCNIIS